jgi:hypothetical protein
MGASGISTFPRATGLAEYRKKRFTDSASGVPRNPQAREGIFDADQKKSILGWEFFGDSTTPQSRYTQETTVAVTGEKGVCSKLHDRSVLHARCAVAMF